MIYRLLYKLLHDSAGVRNRVGTRIYARNAPAGVSGEHIILNIISGTVHDHLTNEADIAERMIQIDFHADRATDAETGSELVRNLLSGYRGEVSMLSDEGVLSAYDFQANLVRPGDLVNGPQDASDRWSYQHSADYQVFYEQSVPTHA